MPTQRQSISPLAVALWLARPISHILDSMILAKTVDSRNDIDSGFQRFKQYDPSGTKTVETKAVEKQVLPHRSGLLVDDVFEHFGKTGCQSGHTLEIQDFWRVFGCVVQLVAEV